MAGQRVTIGKHVIDGGLIYVGQNLPQQRQPHVPENCLIDPRLPISGRGDPEGHSMGYWPSYAGLSAEARKSYLDWVSGPRSDPSAYIGFVFLYFYGLERRLMLEPGAADAGLVVAEVTRLLAVYGSSGSFRRYATALLAAHELRSNAPPEEIAIAADDGGYDVPLRIKAALGARVRDGRPIEPDLLLAYVMSHPETKVRTPAKRAFLQLRELFAEVVDQRYPGGLRVAAGRARRLKATYTACSATFEVEIQPFGGDLPDITGRAEPLATGRALFESCLEQLEDYSRALGRSAGMQPTLSALARLPAGHRRRNAPPSAEAALRLIETLAESGAPCTIADLAVSAGLGENAELGKAKLRVLASTLAAFGYGVTADPTFAARPGKPEEAAIVFPLAAEAVIDPVPSDAYRTRQVALLLGMLVAMVDGQLDDAERRGFTRRIDADAALCGDERRRLKAEIAIHASQPMPLAEAMRRIKDLPERDRAGLADMLIDTAAADGRVDAREVSMLERLFRRIGLDEGSIYARLHAGLAKPWAGPDDDLEIIIPPAIANAGSPIPPPPARAADPRPGRVDASRLEAIRRETHVAAEILAGIFAEPEEEIDDVAVPEAVVREDDDDALFEGLDRRYGALVSEIRQREEWSAADFELLCRSAGLMPGAARQVVNDWALDRFDELFLENEEPILVNIHCLPPPTAGPQAHLALTGEPRVSA